MVTVMAEKKMMTVEGLKKLEDELHERKVVIRKEIADKIKEAREQETFPRMPSMMQRETSSVTTRQRSRNWRT